LLPQAVRPRPTPNPLSPRQSAHSAKAAPATQKPEFPEFLEEERRRRKGMFEQEYMTEFVADDVSVFDRDVVERAVDPKVKPLALRLKFGTSTWDPARK
jgi:hypothetical protein